MGGFGLTLFTKYQLTPSSIRSGFGCRNQDAQFSYWINFNNSSFALPRVFVDHNIMKHNRNSSLLCSSVVFLLVIVMSFGPTHGAFDLKDTANNLKDTVKDTVKGLFRWSKPSDNNEKSVHDKTSGSRYEDFSSKQEQTG